MVISKKSIIAALALGIVLTGCKPDEVNSSTSKGEKDIAGVFDSSHPMMDQVCGISDTVFLKSSSGYEVNICNDGDMFSPQIVPCVGQQPKWGYFTLTNGEVISTADSGEVLDVDFLLVPGYFADVQSWKISPVNGISIDQQTGKPIEDGSWSTEAINPARNEWKIATAVEALPARTFDLSCKISAIQLSLFGDEIAGSRVTLWGSNSKWDVTGSPSASNNEFVVRYTAQACGGGNGCPAPEVSSECEVIYKGVTIPGAAVSTTTLTPSVTGATNPTFAWSTGATTPSITVSPATTTPYAVTVSSGNCVIRTVTFNVNVIDASCQIASSSSSGNGAPNCGAGHHSGNHSGCSHNSSAPANCGSGHYSGNHSACTHVNGSAPNCGPNHRYGNHSGCTHSSSSPANCGNNHHSGNHTGCNHSAPAPNCGPNHRYGNHSGCTHNSSNPANCGTGHHSGNHTGCNHSSNHNSGNGSGSGNGGSGSGNGGSSTGSGGSSNSGGGNTVPGVKVCHVPPGNPGGAATVCVSLSNLGQHLTGFANSGNNGSGGSGSSGSGNGSGTSGSGNGGSGSGGSGSGGNCSHSGGRSGCGTGNGSMHVGDYLGACNSNPCN